MNYPKEILPTNDKGDWHGYCVKYYHSNGQLWWKGVWVNGGMFGSHEHYFYEGDINKSWTGYFLDGNKISDDNNKGYCYIWEKEVII